MNRTHPLQSWNNSIKKGNLKNKFSLGMFIVSASSIISECCSVSGIEWMAVDMEASPATRHDLIHIAQSLNGTSITIFVRVAENNKQLIEAALDVGVHGVIIPKISCAADALSAVQASYYQPMGERGLNPIRCSAYFKEISSYLKNANDSVSCIAQIETRKGVNNLDEIASVKGIGGLFIGCGDLAADYGRPGEFESLDMVRARKLVLEACKKYDLIPGIFAYSEELARKYIDEGFVMVGIGNEIKFLQCGLEDSISRITKYETFANS
jgi:2-keto-3-deoxy-L-rhamnonate aldolase RhmA